MHGPPSAVPDADGELLAGWELIDGPWDVGSEERWRVRLADGRLASYSRLLPELARDESLRRRWVRDVERMLDCGAPSVVPTLAIGPQPDPRDPSAGPPWRLRLEPEGERLSDWLVRAPVPIDELAQIGAALADALHAIHLTGAVVRTLHPRDAIWTPDAQVLLTDVGLARVDLLSSHTASSLLISGSAYAAPEQLLRTVVDQRADLYSLGVILWQAATGSLPFGEGPALLRERVALPPITAVRRDAPPILGLLLARCLAEQPEARPDSAAEIAWILRGGGGVGTGNGLASDLGAQQTVCQHCGAPLRLGQRLCLACGRVGVRFAHVEVERGRGWALELISLREDAKLLADLRTFIVAVAEDAARVDEFVIGDVSLYADHELLTRKRLPARLFNDLDEATARELCTRARAMGLDVQVIEPRPVGPWIGAGVASVLGTIGAVAMLASMGAGAVAGALVVGFAANVLCWSKVSSISLEHELRPLHRLRRAPAALPASDPLVARLAALLERSPPDVRAQLGELALLVQRVVDRRAELTGLVEAKEFELLTGPIEPLIGQIERRAVELAQLDRELGELDEATMVRALASLDARCPEPARRELERRRLLDGLDRLRSLEDRRMSSFHGLLQVSALLRRAIELGLGVHDPAAEQDRHVQLALAALE